VAEGDLRPEELNVIEIDNLIKGIVPAVPITNRTATIDPCIALTIDWISSGKDHRISRDEVASATDVVTKLQDTSKVIGMLESSTIWANSPFFTVFKAVDFCINVAWNIPVVNAVAGFRETCSRVVHNIFKEAVTDSVQFTKFVDPS